MAETEVLRLLIEAETKKAVSEMDKLKRKSGETEKSGMDLSKMMKVGLAGAAVAAGVAFKVASDSFQAFAEKEKVLNRFNASLKAAGLPVKSLSDEWLAFSDQLERTSGVDDDAVLNLASKYMALGRSSEEVKKLIQVSTDLSALTGKDLATSMETLTKADGGMLRELKFLIPGVENLTEAQIANGDAVDIVAKKTAGMAAEINKGSLNAVTQFGNAMEDLNIAMGETVSKWATPVLGFLTDFAREATSAMTAADSFGKSYAENVAAFKKGLDSSGGSISQLQALNTALDLNNKAYKAQIALQLKYKEGTPGYDAAVQEGNRLARESFKLEEELVTVKKKAKAETDALAVAEKKKADAAALAALQAQKATTNLSEFIKTQNYGVLVTTEYTGAVDDGNAALEEAVEWYAKLQEEWDSIKPPVDMLEEAKNILNDYSGVISSLTSSFGDLMEMQGNQSKAQIKNLENEMEAEQLKYDNLIESAKRNGEDTTKIEQDKADAKLAAQTDLDAKKAALDKATFERNKAASLAEIAIQTAVAVMKVAPNAPLMIATGIAGGVQAAIAASQQYPGLKDGGTTTSSGRVLVGEQGPEFLDLPKGATVTPLAKAGGVSIVISGNTFAGTGGLDQLVMTIEKRIGQLKRTGAI